MTLEAIRDKLTDSQKLRAILSTGTDHTTKTTELTQQDLAWLIGQCHDELIAYKLAIMLCKLHDDGI